MLRELMIIIMINMRIGVYFASVPDDLVNKKSMVGSLKFIPVQSS